MKVIFRGRLCHCTVVFPGIAREAIAASANGIGLALGQMKDGPTSSRPPWTAQMSELFMPAPWLSKCKRAIRAVRERVGYPCRLGSGLGYLAESMRLKDRGHVPAKRRGASAVASGVAPVFPCTGGEIAWDEDRREADCVGLSLDVERVRRYATWCG